MVTPVGVAPTPVTGSVMQSPAFRRLFASTVLVTFGVMGQAVARGWLALELTGGSVGNGGVLFAFGAAMLLTTPFGGVAADRYPKRLVLIVAVSLLVASSAFMAIVVAAGIVEYWMLLIASVVQAVAFAVYAPARIAFIADVVAAEQIAPAVVLSQTAMEAMRVIAPVLAGLLMGWAWFGPRGLFTMAALTSAAAGVVLFGIERGAPGGPSHRSPWAEMVDAVRYVRASRNLSLVALTTIGVVVFGFPYLALLPEMAREKYGFDTVGYGVMTGAAGFGAVIAGIVSPRRGWAVRRPWHTIAMSGVLSGVALIALGLAPAFWVALVVLVVVGAAGLVFQTTTQSLLLALSDTEYHGRIQSIAVLGFSGFGLAALPLSALADAVTREWTLIGMGVVVLIVVVAFAGARRRNRRTTIHAAVELA